MTVWALGLNHVSAPLDLRGRFSVAVDRMGQALTALRQAVEVPVEAAILSTCNRTEVYCAAERPLVDRTLHWLADCGGVDPKMLQQHVYALQDADVARHAFRVASGLESMVLGEPQILGQMKAAVRSADDAGALGTTLNQMFQRSFAVAKEVRTATDIGAQSISMAAAAVRLASQLFEDLAGCSVLFVGAGEMIELCATHFSARTPRRIAIANRSAPRGERLARQFGGEAIALGSLPDVLHEFDVVVSCTASTLPLIGLGAVERALRLRRARPMFMLDLAVPRDVEPEVRRLDNIYLYTVDDLASLVQKGKANRQAAVAHAESIIETGVHHFQRWLDSRGNVPLIRQLNAAADGWRQAEIARARRALAKGEDADRVLEALARGLANKMLHGVMAEIGHPDAGERHQAHAAVRRMFLRTGT